MQPVYLSSVIIGSLYHGVHLSRALYDRLSPSLGPLPPPFRRHKPMLCSIRNTESRQPGKAPTFACLWVTGESELSVVQSNTGKLESGAQSNISKSNMLQEFHDLLEQLKEEEAPSVKELKGLEFYADLKDKAKIYQEAKSIFFKAFVKADLGSWVKKPLEQDHFKLPE